MKGNNQKRVENRINKANDFVISDGDKHLLLSYADIFEYVNDFAIDHCLLLIHMYRRAQEYHSILKIKKNMKKGIPGLTKEASDYANKLIKILSYKGLLTKEASNLIDKLDNLINEPNKYFVDIASPSKKDLREFFQREEFKGRKLQAKDFIDSLDKDA